MSEAKLGLNIQASDEKFTPVSRVPKGLAGNSFFNFAFLGCCRGKERDNENLTILRKDYHTCVNRQSFY